MNGQTRQAQEPLANFLKEFQCKKKYDNHIKDEGHLTRCARPWPAPFTRLLTRAMQLS